MPSIGEPFGIAARVMSSSGTVRGRSNNASSFVLSIIDTCLITLPPHIVINFAYVVEYVTNYNNGTV